MVPFDLAIGQLVSLGKGIGLDASDACNRSVSRKVPYRNSQVQRKKSKFSTAMLRSSNLPKLRVGRGNDGISGKQSVAASGYALIR